MEIFVILIAPGTCNRLRNLSSAAFSTLIILRLDKATRKPFQLHGISQEKPSSGPAANNMPFSVWPGCQGPAVLSAFLIQFVDKKEAQLIFQTGNMS